MGNAGAVLTALARARTKSGPRLFVLVWVSKGLLQCSNKGIPRGIRSNLQCPDILEQESFEESFLAASERKWSKPLMRSNIMIHGGDQFSRHRLGPLAGQAL